ncbi:MAG TPA: glycoside hydrolase family 18 protein [Chitinophagaceae bacterium]|nr:glycoside hydrolase family 18 protein [Chitinophagaceae bacterium]
MKNLPVLLIFTLFITTNCVAQKNKDVKVIAYYSGPISELDSIDVNKITHLIFCFGHLDGQRYKVDNAKDTAIIKKMVSLKVKNPQLKVLLSLGGWGGCETCSDAFFTSEGRKEFAGSVKELTNYFKTDGIDLDWEYPAIRLDNDIDKEPVHKTAPEDYNNFTNLVQQLRKILGKPAIITFAAGGFNTYLQKSVDWEKVLKEVDYINLMSYDLINGYATETGHHTALYSTPKQRESTDNAVQYLLKIGVDPKKIIIGAAFYARVWENVPATNNGLYQSGKFKQGISYRDFPERLSAKSGYKSYWDDIAKAPYSYNATEKKFATYDDERSIELKTKYVIDKGLGGIMFWEITNDIHKGGLVDVINKTKESYGPVIKNE